MKSILKWFTNEKERSNDERHSLFCEEPQYESAYKTLNIPSLVSDTLRTGLKGDGRIGADVHPDEDAEKLAQALTQKICAALVCAALILASAVGTSGQQVWIGLSWYQIVCIVSTLILAFALFLPKKR